MLHQLSLTFGSRDLLDRIVKRNPDRQFVLLAATGGAKDLQLLDVSGQSSVFTSHLDYEVKSEHGQPDWHGFFSFNYFTLDVESGKVFEGEVNKLAAEPLPNGMTAMLVLSKFKNSGEYVLLTIWDSSDAFMIWRRSAKFSPFTKYATTLNNFHAATYQMAPPEKHESTHA
ncbi:antibiotic biosynthesis monooxygenase family protein [Levilactobacillus fuyuanensis]|uniref:Monooxygenase n=1 Tax=Levilactobacillus fuyuanensis TaxID=2486022 RepID=A0ABW4H5S9_9LACO|nr:monooxygenase [Levilactobacillus fuyuanensis]